MTRDTIAGLANRPGYCLGAAAIAIPIVEMQKSLASAPAI